MITFNTPKLAKNNTSNTLDFSNTNLQPNKEIDLLLTDESPITVTPDAGYLGMQKVTINHPPVEELTETEITQNGEFHITPSEGYDATMGVTVTVNVELPEYSDVDGMCYAKTQLSRFPTGWKFAPRTGLLAADMFSESSLEEIPAFDTSQCESFARMFYECTDFKTIPKLNASKLVSTFNMFYGCTSLTNVGGFTGLKTDLSFTQGLIPPRNLTKESLLNVINEAADVTANPKTLTFGATNLAKLTDEEKAIATNKGWTLA